MQGGEASADATASDEDGDGDGGMGDGSGAMPSTWTMATRDFDEHDEAALAMAPLYGLFNVGLWPLRMGAQSRLAVAAPLPASSTAIASTAATASTAAASTASARPAAALPDLSSLFHHFAKTGGGDGKSDGDDGGEITASPVVLVEMLKASLEHCAHAIADRKLERLDDVEQAFDHALMWGCVASTPARGVQVSLMLAYAALLRHLAASAIAVTCATVRRSMKDMGLVPDEAVVGGAATAPVERPRTGMSVRHGSDLHSRARLAFIDLLAGSFVPGSESCTPADMQQMLDDVGLLPPPPVPASPPADG